MAETVFVLDEEDAKLLRELLRREKHRTPKTLRAPSIELQDETTTECYFIRSPVDGISALSTNVESTGTGTTTEDDEPGTAECVIYRLVDEVSGYLIEDLQGATQRVFNLFGYPVPANSWVPVVRDKAGYWLVTSASQVYTLTVKESDDSEIVEDVSSIEFDPTDWFYVEPQGAGEARVGWAPGVTTLGLVGHQHNLDLGQRAGLYILQATTAITITGIIPEHDRQFMWLMNLSPGGEDITLESGGTDSDAANRLIYHGFDPTIQYGRAAGFYYDATISRWRRIIDPFKRVLDFLYLQERVVSSYTFSGYIDGGSLGGGGVGTLAEFSSSDGTPAMIAVYEGHVSTVQGLAAGVWGQLGFIYNSGVATIILKHDDPGASVGNRILCPNGVDMTIQGKQGITLYYNDTEWVVVSSTQASGVIDGGTW